MRPVVSAGRLFTGSVAVAGLVGAVLGPLQLTDLELSAALFLGGLGGLFLGAVTGALAATAGLLAVRLAAPAGLRAQRWAFTAVGTGTAVALARTALVPASPLATTLTMLALAAVTALAGALLARRLIVRADEPGAEQPAG
ncbi:hypothetical protein KUM42_02960 [Modestobacter sp. L9-4]|uniref:hypothetical protein n=1 Tax=Modestobacter sp. L9-4 TaxID=2851567 RepID=UPI001C749952|nr:hypothetical protein [Modestobacter sp. L9-4]QXG76530.1 hypothetical protein KUM42_02960 [Modestobacter sp. L9-4]